MDCSMSTRQYLQWVRDSVDPFWSNKSQRENLDICAERVVRGAHLARDLLDFQKSYLRTSGKLEFPQNSTR
jgi:hypothetical protein